MWHVRAYKKWMAKLLKSVFAASPRLIAVSFRPEERMDKRLKKASLSNDEIVLQGSEYKGSYIPVRIETRARPAVSLP